MPGRSKDLSVGQRDSIVELIRWGHSYGQVASMLKIPKTTVYNVFKRYDSPGSTENAKKLGRRKSLDDRHGRKIIRSLRADRKASLSDITNRFNHSENINVCKKQCGGLFEARGIVGAYIQEENTNSRGKQKKTSHVVQRKTTVSK